MFDVHKIMELYTSGAKGKICAAFGSGHNMKIGEDVTIIGLNDGGESCRVRSARSGAERNVFCAEVELSTLSTDTLKILDQEFTLRAKRYQSMLEYCEAYHLATATIDNWRAWVIVKALAGKEKGPDWNPPEEEILKLSKLIFNTSL